MWLGLMVAAGLALGLGGGATRAAPKSSNSPAKLVLPRPDPPGHWRYMTQYPPTTTSKCVGKVTTPMCAVDTLLACFVRNTDNLCRVGLGLNKPPGMVYDDTLVKGEYVKYRVLWAGRKPSGHLTPQQKVFYRNWRKGAPGFHHRWPQGDVKIVMQRVECLGTYCPTRRSWFLPTDYLLQPVSGGWKVLAWQTRCFPEDMNAPGCW